jgi:hypothetical protein
LFEMSGVCGEHAATPVAGVETVEQAVATQPFASVGPLVVQLAT